MILKINKWWMELNSAVQYIIWICTFCLILLLGCIGIVFMADNNILSPNYIAYSLVGIATFVGFFMTVILYLTIVWPSAKLKKSIQKK